MSDDLPIQHSRKFRIRRVLNWFPLGLTYAFLYMGRYNLTVAKTSLGDLMTKEDFGIIFGVGTTVYAFAFLINGPLTDKIGGKRAILIGALGSAVMNLVMGLFIRSLFTSPGAVGFSLVTVMSVLYAINMYFQSFGAVAIVKVNSYWFHVRERGGFSGIFGTMITSGIFFAFTVNGWILGLTKGWGPGGSEATWWVFFIPSFILLAMFVIEVVLLRDRPGQAGLEDFDTGDASSGEKGEKVRLLDLMKKIVTNPIILTIAVVEFCTGVLRNGVMHWFPIYASEVWALPRTHALRNGSWENWAFVVVPFGVAALLFALATRIKGKARAYLIISGALCALAPFFQGGWGGILFVAGVAGGNIAGWVSDLFFQSRRAPAAGGLYFMLGFCIIGIFFALGEAPNRVGWVGEGKVSVLLEGDEILKVAGTEVRDWKEITRAVACVPSRCQGEGVQWDLDRCMCTSEAHFTSADLRFSEGALGLEVLRAGQRVTLDMPDDKVQARAGDRRRLVAGPVLSVSPFWLGMIMFIMSLSVIGTHGLLSGTATMDFGGTKGAATAVGMIDGFVYLGTAVQSYALGYLTTQSWHYWPIFLFPFAILGFYLLTRIWHAKPGRGGH